MTQLPASGRSAICSGPCNNAGFGRKVEHDSLARERFEVVIVDPNPASTESAGDQTGNMALPAAGDLNETPEQGAELPFGSERGNA